jgi:hypothetical protein
MEMTKPKAVRRASDAEEKMVKQESAEIRYIVALLHRITI